MNVQSAGLPPEIAERLAALQSARFKGFSAESLAWLALPPSWTETLAAACGFPPVDGLDTFLAEVSKAGLCVRDARQDGALATAEIARTLAALWPQLEPAMRREYHSVLEGYALQMPDPEEAIALLIAMRVEPRDQRVEESLGARIHALPSEVQARLYGFAAMQWRNPEVLREADEAAASLPAGSQRVTLQLALAERAASIDAPPTRPVLVSEAMALADPAERAGALLRLDLNDRSVRSQALKAIRKIPDLAIRARQWSMLFKATGDDAVGRRAFKTAKDVLDTSLRCRTLATLAHNCRADLGREILQRAWVDGSNVQDTAERTSLLALTASQWAPLEPEVAFERARQVEPIESRAEVMLACLASEELRDGEIEEVVSRTIHQIPLPSLRNSLLLRLASYRTGIGPPQLRQEILSIAESYRDENERRNALLNLLPQLEAKERFSIAEKILGGLRRICDASARRSALIRLVPFLDLKQKWKALSIAADPQPDRGFRVNEASRTEIIDYVRTREGRLFLYNTACRIGKAIADAAEFGVPESTQRWAQMAALMGDSGGTSFPAFGIKTDALPASEAGGFLTRQVRQFADAGNAAAALDWLSAASLLAQVAGEDLQSAVQSGKHRVELRYRRAVDERHLRRYLERAEQTAAFQELIDGPDSHWAIHFLGVGGVGKTMLLRQISARLAVKDGQRLATSRVDFDHISPEFPVRKPGQLLAELADELRIYGGSSRIEARFAEFQDRLLTLHAELSAQPPPEDPLRNINSPAFAEVTAGFADLVKQLPPPVILILDTCEELSKLEPINSRLPSVEATFAILERLHERIPSIRVVFAGRRLLAQAGDADASGAPRWVADDRALGERVRSLPAQKNYLRLHVIRGFTPSEGDDFLGRIADVRLDKEQREAILERSREVSTPAPIRWTAPSTDIDPPRTNPFDLSLYAEWLRDASHLKADVIRSGDTDPYVEMRIVRRLENEPRVLRALPAAVLLRRFDEDMLRAVEPGDSDRAALFQELRGHEWTDAQRDEELETWFLEVNTNLRRRIDNYYAVLPRRLELDRMRELLAPDMDRMVRALLQKDRWSRELTFTRLEPALRLQAPEAAARLWDEIDARITQCAEWNWPFQMCPQLLGEENVAGSTHSPLRAAIRATLNAAQLHVQRDFDPRLPWAEVAETAVSHPVPEMRDWLTYRAGLFTASTGEERLELKNRHGERWPRGSHRHQQALAGYLARAYEARDRLLAADDLSSWPETTSVPIDLRLLAGLAAGDPDGEAPEDYRAVQCWADWRVPDCLMDRIRLEAILNERRHAK